MGFKKETDMSKVEITIPVTFVMDLPEFAAAGSGLGAAVYVLDAVLPGNAKPLMLSAGVSEIRYDTTVIRAERRGEYVEGDEC